ncbi:hypothetical protein ACFX2G_032903 [Malus domestica]
MEIAKRHLNVTIASMTRDPQALHEPAMASAQNENSPRLLSTSEDDGVLGVDVVVDSLADCVCALVRKVDDDTELAEGSGGGGGSGDEGSWGDGL